MPQLLLEIFSEEIPARMQGNAARDLERMAKEGLAKAGLTPESLRTYAGPRRLTLVAEGLPAATPDVDEERKGPRVGSPDQAVEGFLRSTGLSRADLTERDGVYYASLSKKGRPTPEIVAALVEEIARGFPWPKSMRWGTGSLRWVRPIQRILCLFDGAVVPFAIDGIESGDVSEGHRFMGGGAPFCVINFADYEAKLRKHFVILDAAERKSIILDGAQKACAAEGLELVEDEGLLDEVAGLAEWPVPILGRMDPAFLDLPPEVIRTSMRTHQKYFAVRDPKTGGLAPRFLAVANIEAPDGGQAIAEGNARVLSARLNDARFFWDEDNKPGNFDRWLEKLNGVTFHAKLGTMAERVERITALAREIAPLVGADPELAAEAARLCKADLASGMVGEFPELQGVMGGYYARAAGLESEVADAIRDHYKPQGPSDAVPTAPITVAVALADKLDTLVGFFAIDEKPTGSRDPYALRRAALGVIRIALDNKIRFSLKNAVASVLENTVVTASWEGVPAGPVGRVADWLIGWWNALEHTKLPEDELRSALLKELRLSIADDPIVAADKPRSQMFIEGFERFVASEQKPLLAFFADRLKVLLRDQGKRHDLVDAVFALGDDELVRIVARVEALDQFLSTDDGANLLASYKRAANILKAEAKKGELPQGIWTSVYQHEAEELALSEAVHRLTPDIETQLQAEHFSAAMAALSTLRSPVDAFFEKVLVNADDPAVRANRLRLLGQVRALMNRVADFSLISG